MKVRIAVCSVATKEHRSHARLYAHTFHRKNVICVANTFKLLPVRFQVGILLHECGHLLLGSRRHSEKDADCILEAANYSGVKIRRARWRDASNLECVAPRDVRRGVDALNDLLDGIR